MKEWHIQHMEKTILKYIVGLPENATAWEKRQHRRYGGITRVYRQINYDIKHGATNEEVLELLEAIKNDSATSLNLALKDVDHLKKIQEQMAAAAQRTTARHANAEPGLPEHECG
jgi:hypothetical protein